MGKLIRAKTGREEAFRRRSGIAARADSAGAAVHLIAT